MGSGIGAAFGLCLAFAVAPACHAERSPTVQPLPEPDERAPLLEAGPHTPRIANYHIEAALDDESHRIEGRQTLRWQNSGASAVEVLPFHLYMNAFKNSDTVFMRESRGVHRRAHATAGGWGWIALASVSVDHGPNVLSQARYPGPDETVVEIPLAEPLAPGDTVTVDMEFEVQLPVVFARTGYRGAFTMVGQWFPKIGVRTEASGQESWHCTPFHLNSEFFADFGTYDVALTVPSTLVVAATGVLVEARENDDGTRTLEYRAEDVHDFAWMADPYMQFISAPAKTELGEVEVRVYHRPEQRGFAVRHLQAGVGAIEQFSRLLLPYPWPIMSIIDPPVDAADGAGGMEYPTLVTTAGDSFFLRRGIRAAEYTTVHEVGHNWLQGLLASNEVDEAWLDEGTNDWIDGVAMEALYGRGTSMIDWRGFQSDGFGLFHVFGHRLPAEPIDTPSYRFSGWEDYATASYMRTALALQSLANVVGQEQFRAAMRAYARKFAWHHPTGEDLFHTLESELGQDLDWFLEPVFRDRGTVDFEVRHIDCRRPHDPRGVFGSGAQRRTVTEAEAPEESSWACDVLVTNNGNVPIPVVVEATLDDGSKVKERWDDHTTWHRFHVDAASPVVEVAIDPDRHVLLDSDLTNNSLRRVADRGASRRAAARGQFWTQTAMQVTGL